MTRPLVVLRPVPGSSATAAAAAKLGLSVVVAPLFAIEPRPWAAPDPATIEGLLVGSANALRHAGRALEAFREKPVYAVGEATAAAARKAGFEVALTGEGGLQRVLGTLGGRRMVLLRLAGEAHIPLEPPEGVELVTRIVYAGVPQSLSQEAAETLRSGAVALLHSAEAAGHFGSECDRLGLDRGCIAIAALGPRIADAVGKGWRTVESAPTPTDAALLALAERLCHAAR